MESSSTKDRILATAHKLCQTLGFNAFSYHTISKELNIKTASIHYYYPTKSDLGAALISSYQESFLTHIKNIDENNSSAKAKLSALIRLMSDLEQNHKLCLCAMLASEYESLSSAMKAELAKFFLQLEKWVSEKLTQGLAQGEFNFSEDALILAQSFIATLHGTLICSRATGDKSRMQKLEHFLFSNLT